MPATLKERPACDRVSLSCAWTDPSTRGHGTIILQLASNMLLMVRLRMPVILAV